MKLTVDIDTMTLGEIEYFEDVSGLDISELSGGKVNVKAILALLVIQERHHNPLYSLDDARKIPVKDLEVEFAEDPQDEAEETAEAEPEPRPKARAPKRTS